MTSLLCRIEADAAIKADLLEALKQFCNELDNCDHRESLPLLCRFCMARAAIAKAEGK